MKLSSSQLRKIIKEELDEVFGDLGEPYPEDALRKAGLRAKQKDQKKEITPFLPDELSLDVIGDIKKEFGVPEEQATSIVQKVLDLLRKKGASFGE